MGVLIIAIMSSFFSGMTSASALQVQTREVAPVAQSALPPGTTLLPASLVQIIDTSNASWDPSAPDTSGVDYWPSLNRLLVVDSEVDEMPNYFQGKNVYLATTSGNLTGTCTTTSFSLEPTGVGINPNNNHIFISTDDMDRIFEVSLGADGVYCTGDDLVTTLDVAAQGVGDAEDVAYGNNTIFIAGGTAAEVFSIPLGPDGVLGGGDDGPLTHFDTAALGFHDLEGIGYRQDSDTLFIVSTQGNENYLGETSLTGTLLAAYDLSFMGTNGNIRSDVSYAPGSQNPAINHIYIASRGVDNNNNPNENDGKIWEIDISGPDGPPSVASITRADPSPTSADSVRFSVIFSEYVTGVDAADFLLSSSGVTGASISSVSGGAAIYTVTVNTGSGIGTLELQVADNDSIRDNAAESLGGSGLGNGNYLSGEVYDLAANTEIYISETKQGSYRIAPQESSRQAFTGINQGPVKLLNTNNNAMLAAERIIYKVNNVNTSFSEMMALPQGQLDNVYWLPWYNNVDLDTQLRFGNVSGSTATVHLFIGGQEKTTGCTPSNSPYTLQPGASLRVACAGVSGGPVEIRGTQNIVAAERIIYKVNNVNTSFSEMMALPERQLNVKYWLPWYNNVALDTQLRFGNVSTSTATVRLFIGGQEKTTGCTPSNSPYTLQAGESLRVSCQGVDSGPVEIRSTQTIVAAERIIYKVNGINTSFSEMMALPDSQVNTTFWLPWYNNLDLDSQLRIANVSGSAATVRLFIGGQEKTTGCTPSNSPYTLQPGASLRVACAGVNSGPIEIRGTQNIVAAERIIYKVNNVNTSFSEMMALPNSQLDGAFWLPWYNNLDLDTQLRFGRP